MVTLNFSKFCHLQSTIDSEFLRGGVWAPTFFGHSKFEVIFFGIFNLQSTVDAEFFTEGSGHQLFLVTLNLRSKIFRNFFIYRVLWNLNCSQRGLWAPTFFGHAKFEVKNFENFFVYRVLWTEFFRGGVGALIFFDHTEFFGIFSFTEHSGL